MIFRATDLAGAYVVDLERSEDERGFFARTFCAREFQTHGLKAHFVQCSTSFNKTKGTLRGMHYQAAPHEEAKLVRCTMGSIFDVIIDLCPQSPTFTQHFAVELSAANRRMLYIPEGFAHGFQTLEDNTEVFYQMSEFFVPDCARGIRWNDQAFDIRWPDDVRTISMRDQQYPNFKA
ncbi:MAG: dTDP-4-dehydrorhamnose 3,5-epimerase [Nitrospira defluvii]|nr:dTDP-4-dehydrorhamnose 3,5-epimerase [Nitrospira defluvii]